QFQASTYDLHFFTSGETCVKQLNNLSPDILVLDYNLDGDMNGLDTLKEIRYVYPNAVAVLFSTEGGLNTDENHQRYGHFAYIEKKENAVSYLRTILFGAA